MPDPDYIVASRVQDGVLFEVIVSQVDVALVESGRIKELTTSPRVRMTKEQEKTTEVQES
jgi:hypothetical protein